MTVEIAREDWLYGLQHLQEILKQFDGLSQQIEQADEDYKAGYKRQIPPVPQKQPGLGILGGGKGVAVVAAASLVLWMILSFLANRIFESIVNSRSPGLQTYHYIGPNLLALPVAIVLAILIRWIIARSIKRSAIRWNAKVDQQNIMIAEQNRLLDHQNAALYQSIVARKEKVEKSMDVVREDYGATVASWFPENYLADEAVAFFVSAIASGRADNLKEAINLFETHQHQQRTELMQQEQLLMQQNQFNLQRHQYDLQQQQLTMQQEQLNLQQQQMEAQERLRKQQLILGAAGIAMQAAQGSATRKAISVEGAASREAMAAAVDKDKAAIRAIKGYQP